MSVFFSFLSSLFFFFLLLFILFFVYVVREGTWSTMCIASGWVNNIIEVWINAWKERWREKERLMMSNSNQKCTEGKLGDEEVLWRNENCQWSHFMNYEGFRFFRRSQVEGCHDARKATPHLKKFISRREKALPWIYDSIIFCWNSEKMTERYDKLWFNDSFVKIPNFESWQKNTTIWAGVWGAPWPFEIFFVRK